MKTEAEIKANIAQLERDYAHVLEGSRATVQVNAPRALMQVSAQSRLEVLYWVLGGKYKSKLKGVNT